MLSMLMLIYVPVPSAPDVRTYAVEGIDRQALIYAPSRPSARPPLVFGFHGHGGNMRQAARSFRMHEEWPEAVVVYMQGLPTPTPNDPEGKRPGWQVTARLGSQRDLKFFDSVYRDVTARFHVDTSKVFSMGHSNGGRFTYLLWAERADKFRAFAPSGSPASGLKLNPKPAFHLMGERDAIVSPENQRRTIAELLAMNGCGKEGQPFGRHSTLYPGKEGNDVVTYIHPGGHQFPIDAPALMVKFFKRY